MTAHPQNQFLEELPSSVIIILARGCRNSCLLTFREYVQPSATSAVVRSGLVHKLCHTTRCFCLEVNGYAVNITKGQSWSLVLQHVFVGSDEKMPALLKQKPVCRLNPVHSAHLTTKMSTTFNSGTMETHPHPEVVETQQPNKNH